MINITNNIPIVGIYKITSPSNKIYIGQSINIKERFNAYKWLSCKSQIKLYRSLKKYGVENHIFEIIEECPESYLNELETWWKLFYNTVEDGLNFYYWDQAINRGRKLSEKHRNNISKALKNKPKSIGFGTKVSISKIGKKDTEKTKKNKFEAAKKVIRTPSHQINLRESINKTLKEKGFSEERNIKIRKCVIQFDKEGNFIKEWKSISEITKTLQIYNIEQVCKGKHKSAGGFVWKYK